MAALPRPRAARPQPAGHVTLRLRLTLWYSSVLTVVLTLFGLAVYFILVWSLTWQIDQTLKTVGDEIIQASSVSQVLDARVVTIPRLEDRFGASNVFVQVWRLNGELATQSDNLRGFNQPLDGAHLGSASAAWHNVRVTDSHLRVFTTPILTADGTRFGTLQVGASLQGVDVARTVLLLVLVGGGILAVLLAALIGYASADRALKPLQLITRAALQITRADDLSRRVPVATNPLDEVGRMAMAFNESLERLERLFAAQRRFLADVSHELRTPLTTIRGNVDLLRRMTGGDDESLAAIQSEADRMTRLVGDLLLLAQADAGNLPLAREVVELDTLLLEVEREAKVLAESAGVTVGIGEIDQALVIGDRDRLKQVLLNLLSNAVKFSPAGGRVTLGLGCVGQYARVTVSDMGAGIAADELTRIFDRFYRVDKARSRALGGAGLGLAIAQHIARLHGGRIEAASEGVAGRGSTFSVWLPLKPNGAAAGRAEAAGGRRALDQLGV